MIASLAVTVGLLLQAAGNGHPARANRAPEPVRIWRADSTAYVTLRQPGDLLVLHVDAIGRIQVLLPAGPDDDSGMLANERVVRQHAAVVVRTRGEEHLDATDGVDVQDQEVSGLAQGDVGGRVGPPDPHGLGRTVGACRMSVAGCL